MSKKNNDGNFKVKGTETWVNQQTGEVREVLKGEVNLEKGNKRESGFVIAILSYVIKMTDLVGNKKMKVVNYILENMALKGQYANRLFITQRELAKKTKVSIQTVSTTLKTLEKKKIIQKKTGAIMLHPNVISYGSASNYDSLMIQFKEFNKGQAKKKDSTADDC